MKANSQERRFFGHPRGLAYIIFTEAWERFSFYGMQALLVLYMVGHLLQPGTVSHVVGLVTFRLWLREIFGHIGIDAQATQIFGIYGGLVYLMPVFGGLVGDRLLGRRAAIITGAVIMAIGHFLMAFEAAFLLALTCLIIGCGLLKGNLAAQVGALYQRDDPRRDRGYSIYFVSINIGASVAPLVCGSLGELYGWKYGFTAAGIGMVIGLCVYLIGQPYLPTDNLSKEVVRKHLKHGDGRVIAGLLFVLLVMTFFWTAQSQVWNAYPLWIRDHVNRQIFGFTFPITWFQSVDSIAVLVTAPVTLWVWRAQSERHSEPSDLVKIVIGCAVFALACCWLSLSEIVSRGGKVAIVWPLLFHFISAWGYLYAAPTSLALFSRAAPPSVNSMMAGVYYLALFAGSIVSGWLGRFYTCIPSSEFWLLHGAVAGVGSVLILVAFGPLRRVLRAPEGEEVFERDMSGRGDREHMCARSKGSGIERGH